MRPPVHPFGEEYNKRTRGSSTNPCCLCGREIRETPVNGRTSHMVPVNHCHGEFIPESPDGTYEGEGTTVSFYPIGPECVKTWRKHYGVKR